LAMAPSMAVNPKAVCQMDDSFEARSATRKPRTPHGMSFYMTSASAASYSEPTAATTDRTIPASTDRADDYCLAEPTGNPEESRS
jgi:hypothetical protein